METIGKQIAARRKEKKLTQKTFAEEMGLALVTIKLYETDKLNPSTDILQKMSVLFKCNLVIKFEDKR